MKKLAWALAGLAALFLISFQFFHTDRVITAQDNCPIGIFERTSPLHVPPPPFVLLVVFILITIASFLSSPRPEEPSFLPTPKRRAPPL